MFYHLKKTIRTSLFNWQCREILSTAPLVPIDADVTIMSTVCHRDLIMYLVAVKSFYRFLKRGRIVERGHHVTLLERGGAYAEMWARQQETAEEEESTK